MLNVNINRVVIIQSTHCSHHVSGLNVILGLEAGDLVHSHLFWQPPSHHPPRLLLEREALQVVMVVMVVVVVMLVMVVLVVFMVLILLDAMNIVIKSLTIHSDCCGSSHHVKAVVMVEVSSVL